MKQYAKGLNNEVVEIKEPALYKTCKFLMSKKGQKAVNKRTHGLDKLTKSCTGTYCGDEMKIVGCNPEPSFVELAEKWIKKNNTRLDLDAFQKAAVERFAKYLDNRRKKNV